MILAAARTLDSFLIGEVAFSSNARRLRSVGDAAPEVSRATQSIAGGCPAPPMPDQRQIGSVHDQLPVLASRLVSARSW